MESCPRWAFAVPMAMNVCVDDASVRTTEWCQSHRWRASVLGAAVLVLLLRRPPLEALATRRRDLPLRDPPHLASSSAFAAMNRSYPIDLLSLPSEAFAARYYNGFPGAADLYLEEKVARPAYKLRTMLIDHSCKASTADPFPPPGVNPEEFWAVWEGRWWFDDDTYRFTVTAADGVRLFVDGELVFERWTRVSVPGGRGGQGQAPHLVALARRSWSPRTSLCSAAWVAAPTRSASST